jgi:predicted glycogen debranching enzyme
LRTFAKHVKRGLIPNLFPEGKNSGLYHTADASLWFFHAINRYLNTASDETLLPQILPKLEEIIRSHLAGTDFGIRVDPADGLLTQGTAHHPLTWMDAKEDDWIVTPRRGKAVEINALWYNALCLMEKWLAEAERPDAAAEMAEHASRARQSFQKRFWNERECFLYDVVDGEHGDDECFRPNQVLAFSLDHPILAKDKWAIVLEKVKEKLLTPVGLRSLAQDEKNYKAEYHGDLRVRDAAYHQGTVWAWLIGPFADAWLRVHPEAKAELREMLRGFEQHLGECAIGSVSEIFDAEAPYRERGCVAQAWSVAEVLRAWIRTHIQ